MDMETWFAPAIEMGRLVRQYRIAQEDEKVELERRIQNSAYISRLNTMQSFSSVDFLRGIVEEQKVNFIKRDFFLNPATPSFGGEGEAHYQLSYHRHDYMEFILCCGEAMSSPSTACCTGIRRGMYVCSIPM